MSSLGGVAGYLCVSECPKNKVKRVKRSSSSQLYDIAYVATLAFVFERKLLGSEVIYRGGSAAKKWVR